MYKRSSQFHNSPSVTRRGGAYRTVVHRDVEQVNEELRRRRVNPDEEAEQRRLQSAPEVREDLAQLLGRLCGEAPVSQFLAALPDRDFGSLLQLLWSADIYPSGDGLNAIRVSAARDSALQPHHRALVTRAIEPAVEALIATAGVKA